MKIVEVKDKSKILINKLVEIWEDSVKATHLFLQSKEIENIKEYVPQALQEVSNLIIAENENNDPIAFMGINKNKVEMLFVKNSERKKGIGEQLLNYGIFTIIFGLGYWFSVHLLIYFMGVQIDEQGNNYPILYMRLEK